MTVSQRHMIDLIIKTYQSMSMVIIMASVEKIEGFLKREIPIKIIKNNSEGNRLAIGELADVYLADRTEKQHATLSRWRSGVQIPPGSPYQYLPVVFSVR